MTRVQQILKTDPCSPRPQGLTPASGCNGASAPRIISFKDFVKNFSSGKPLDTIPFVSPTAVSERASPTCSEQLKRPEDKNKISRRSTLAKTVSRTDGLQQKLLTFISAPPDTSDPLEVTETRREFQRPTVNEESMGLSEVRRHPFLGLKRFLSVTPVQNHHRISASRIECRENVITRLIQEHPTFPVASSGASFISYAQSQHSKEDTKHWLWTDKYAPNSCSHFLYNGHGVKTFQRWLQRWKRHASRSTGKWDPEEDVSKWTKGTGRHQSDSSDDDFLPDLRPVKRRKTMPPSNVNQFLGSTVMNDSSFNNVIRPVDFVDSDTSSNCSESSASISYLPSDDEDSSSREFTRDRNDWLTKAYLLVGPPGTGKTSLVHAVANDLGFKVFELNPSIRRSGKDILGQFQIALDSHHVSKEHLSTEFSTFQMTNTKKIDGSSGRRKNSVANFFTPQASFKGGVNSSSSKTPNQRSPQIMSTACASKGLNLSCNSLVLVDEADVLFDSDRGFWSALSNLLQLARRPIVLTASDASLAHNLPIHAHVCHIKRPPPDLIIPYLRLICATEGLHVDATSIELLHRLNTRSCEFINSATVNPVPCGDLRGLINQLQWLVSVASSHSEPSSLPIDLDSLETFSSDPLEWLPKEHPFLSSVHLFPRTASLDFTPLSRAKFDVSEAAQSEANGNSFCEVFNDDADIKDSASEIQPQSSHETIYTVTSALPNTSATRSLMTSTLQILSKNQEDRCWLDSYESRLLCSYTRHTLDYCNVSDTDELQSTVTTLATSCSTLGRNTVQSVSLGVKSSNTTMVNPVMATSLAPVFSFQQSSDDILRYCCAELSDLSHSKCTSCEKDWHALCSSLATETVTTLPTTSIRPSCTPSVDATALLLNRMQRNLNNAELSCRHLGHAAVCNKRSMASDYLPFLRTIASGETTRQSICSKRRYLHYFDRIGLGLHRSVRSLLCTPTFVDRRTA
ncbi:unnamed protein product [Dicrocoelium dendriticum]|nr:unnamed protein product [Dicrocoelium dendriticum]